jgi:hypothetical protein
VSVVSGPGATDWTPGRGDYGADNVGDMIAIVEEHNCAHGCTRAGTRKQQRDAGGPGGFCSILARLVCEEVMPEMDPREDGPHCRERIPLPPKPERAPRRRPAPAGMEPML